jgi:hypothetical protein
MSNRIIRIKNPILNIIIRLELNAKDRKNSKIFYKKNVFI